MEKAPARWTKVDVKRMARRVLGTKARVWLAPDTRRWHMGFELPSGGRYSLTSGATLAELVDNSFIKPLASWEKAKAEGYDPDEHMKVMRELKKPPREVHEEKTPSGPPPTNEPEG